MENEEATNPVEGEDLANLPETEVDNGIEDQLFDDDGNPIPGEPEDEEIEVDEDLKLKVPKDQAQKIKDALLRQADYTRKTQSLAQERQQFEQARSNFHNMDSQEFTARATLLNVDQQLAQYQNVNFQAALNQANANFDEDGKAAIQAAFMQFTQLKDTRAQALAIIGQAQQQRTFHEQQATAKQMEEGRAALKQAIPEWNDTHRANLVSYASQFGFSAQDLSDLEADPRAARILHEAFKGSKARQTAAKTQQIQAAQKVTPAAKVGGGSPPPGKLDDRLSAEEWTRRRNEQVRKRA